MDTGVHGSGAMAAVAMVAGTAAVAAAATAAVALAMCPPAGPGYGTGRTPGVGHQLWQKHPLVSGQVCCSVCEYTYNSSCALCDNRKCFCDNLV